jgi:hypothetical protein
MTTKEYKLNYTAEDAYKIAQSLTKEEIVCQLLSEINEEIRKQVWRGGLSIDFEISMWYEQEVKEEVKKILVDAGYKCMFFDRYSYKCSLGSSDYSECIPHVKVSWEKF